MLRAIVVLTMIASAAMLACAADLDALRDCAKWLKTERLRGTLFHRANVEPLRPMLLEATNPAGREGAPTPVGIDHGFPSSCARSRCTAVRAYPGRITLPTGRLGYPGRMR